MLEKKIEELGSYFDSMFKLPEGNNGIKVIIPENWKIYGVETDEYAISVQPIIENNIKKIRFVGSLNVKIGTIIDFANQVILNNIENEKKKELFQLRVKELANIFDNNRLSKLETLGFKFEKNKKQKSKEKISNAETTTEIVNETNNL